MDKILKTMFKLGVLPTVVLDGADKAVPLAKALAAGGLPVAEVTFCTDAAADSIRAIASEVPDVLVGAGAVLSKEQVDAALDAGAKFITTSGFNPEIVKYGLSRGALMIPGTATGGEMEQALALGVEAVKFFPAERNGGVETLKALSAPYKDIMWIPAGGIDDSNLAEYLDIEQVLACSGSWVAPKELIDGCRWDDITAACRKAVETLMGLHLAHIGIYCSGGEEADQVAMWFSEVFGVPYRPGEGGNFAGGLVECIKGQGRGAKGHIAIGTNNVDRAWYHFELRGYEFLPDSYSADERGRSKAIYFKGELAGFTVHLMQK